MFINRDSYTLLGRLCWFGALMSMPMESSCLGSACWMAMLILLQLTGRELFPGIIFSPWQRSCQQFSLYMSYWNLISHFALAFLYTRIFLCSASCYRTNPQRKKYLSGTYVRLQEFLRWENWGLKNLHLLRFHFPEIFEIFVKCDHFLAWISQGSWCNVLFSL